METDTLRTTLDSLRSEEESVEARAKGLRTELDAVETRLSYVRGAINNIEALLGEPSTVQQVSGRVDAHSSSSGGASVRTLDFSDTPDAPPRKRVKSTDWVAGVVRELGQPATRDEIFEAFQQKYGIPDSWNANPRNSFNNALGRAVERHMVRKWGDDQYVSAGTVSLSGSGQLGFGGPDA